MDFAQLLSAASEAMSAPEVLVGRSARARATAEGVAPEQILAGWAGVDAGGMSAPAPSTAAPDPAAEVEQVEPDDAARQRRTRRRIALSTSPVPSRPCAAC